VRNFIVNEKDIDEIFVDDTRCFGIYFFNFHQFRFVFVVASYSFFVELCNFFLKIYPKKYCNRSICNIFVGVYWQ